MAEQRKSGYCNDCQKRVVIFRPGTNHILHLLLALVTLGLWLIVWFLHSIKIGGWRCSQCGSTRVSLSVSPASGQGQGQKLKKCPFCAEEIRAEASKCRYCGSELSVSVQANPTSTIQQGSCNYCGRELRQSAKFCIFCGKPVSTSGRESMGNPPKEPYGSEVTATHQTNVNPEVVKSHTIQPGPPKFDLIGSAGNQQSQRREFGYANLLEDLVDWIGDALGWVLHNKVKFGVPVLVLIALVAYLATSDKSSETSSVLEQASAKATANPSPSQTPSEIKPAALVGGITTLKEFENSDFYKANRFRQTGVGQFGVGRQGYHSDSTGGIIAIETEAGKIAQTRFAYSENKLPSRDVLLLHVITFIGEMTGIKKDSQKEFAALRSRVSERLADKSVQPFEVNGRKVMIDIIDASNPYASEYLAVIVSNQAGPAPETSASRAKSKPQRSKSTARTGRILRTVPVAPSEVVFYHVYNALKRGRSEGVLAAMMQDEGWFLVQAGTKVEIVTGGTILKGAVGTKILSGSHTGKEAWLNSADVALDR